MKKLLSYIIVPFFIISGAHAQSSAMQSQPGFLTTSGCPGGQFSCFVPYSSASPLAVAVFGGTSGQVLTSNGAGNAATFQPGGGSGSGTVNSGTQYRLGYYATTGTAISGLASITTNATNDLVVGNTATNGLEFFNTTDQTTNFDRLRIFYNSNVASILSDSGGTGTTRNLALGTANNLLTLNGVSLPAYKFARLTGITGNIVDLSGVGLMSSSAQQNAIVVNPIVQQTSTANYAALVVNPTELSVGSGTNYLQLWEHDSTPIASLTDAGVFTLGANTVATSGNNLGFFAPTTSTQLLSVVPDATGTGALVFGTSPTFTTGLTASNITNTVTGANGMTCATISGGMCINATASTTGSAVVFTSTAAAQTGTSAVRVIGTATITADYAGAYISLIPVRNMIAAATRAESGNMINANPTYSITGSSVSIMNVTGAVANFTRTISNTGTSASSSLNLSGPVAAFTNPAVTRTNPVVDTAPVVTISQADTAATGDVLVVTNSGTGNTANFNGSVILQNQATGTNADFLCLSSAGKILVQTSACTISSQRFKDNIISFNEDALDQVLQLRPVTFTMKRQENPNPDINFSRKQIGLIAEEVNKVNPDLAIYEQDGKTPKSYRQESVIALLIKALQDQQKEIEQLSHGDDVKVHKNWFGRSVDYLEGV